MVVNHTTFKERFGYYDFYKTPDGQQCLPKTYYYTKYGAMGGAVFSIYEMILISKPATLHSAVARFGRFTLPFAGMGFVFGTSLCALAQIRKKDDVANHVIAGALAGGVWGLKYNRVSVGHTWAILLGFIAGYVKYFKINDLPIIHLRSNHEESYNPKFDFTIKFYEDPGRPDEA